MDQQIENRVTNFLSGIECRIELPGRVAHGDYVTGLVIASFNRPAYLRRCFKSLRRSYLEDTLLLLIDDGSTDPETLRLLRGFSHPQCPVIKIYRNSGSVPRIHENLRCGWDYLSRVFGCSRLANLDADAVVRVDWLQRMAQLYDRQVRHVPSLLVTGFNTINHPVLEYGDDCVRKESIGGINLFFDAGLYDDLVRPTLTDLGWDWRLVERMAERNYPLFCTRPSVIQHIGCHGLWSTPQRFDYALDYWGTTPLMLSLAHWFFYGRRRISRWRAPQSQ